MFCRIFFLVMCLYSVAFGQTENVLLHPNEGQWDSQIHFRADMHQGNVLINQTGFTYFLSDAMSHDHDGKEKEPLTAEEKKIHCQIVRSEFLNTSWKGIKTTGQASQSYRNYYQGSDRSKWRSKVYSTDKVIYDDVYTGIDLIIEGQTDFLKYSFVLAPGADIKQIITKISGSKEVFLREGDLVIRTDFGEIIE